MPDALQLHVHFIHHAGLQRLRLRMPRAVRQIKDAGAHQGCGAIWCNLTEAHNHSRNRRAAGDKEHCVRVAQHTQRLSQRRRGKERYKRFVRAQVTRQSGGQPAGTPAQGCMRAMRRAMRVVRHARLGGSACTQCGAAQPQRGAGCLQTAVRIGSLPAARQLQRKRLRG